MRIINKVSSWVFTNLASLIVCMCMGKSLQAAERPHITFMAAYLGEPIINLRGGIRTGGTYLDNLYLQISAEPGTLFGLPGLSGQLSALYNNANQFKENYAGELQGVSNIDAPEAVRFYAAWLDLVLAPADWFSMRAGLYDLNSEFDVLETGSLFLNSAHGMGQSLGSSGLNGPSTFPVTALALRARAVGVRGAYGQVVILDGVPGDPDNFSSSQIRLSSSEGALLAVETGWSGGAWRKLAVGFWRYTADFDPLFAPDQSGASVPVDGNQGWYALADRIFWSDDRRTLAGFLRLGQAESRFNAVDRYLGSGITLTGFWPARPDDEVGLGVAMAFTGRQYRKAQQLAGFGTDGSETVIELTWKAPLTDWLTLQPDCQYIINPGTNTALGNALTVSLRFMLQYARKLH